jgi:hypothetical protein
MERDVDEDERTNSRGVASGTNFTSRNARWWSGNPAGGMDEGEIQRDGGKVAWGGRVGCVTAMQQPAVEAWGGEGIRSPRRRWAAVPLPLPRAEVGLLRWTPGRCSVWWASASASGVVQFGGNDGACVRSGGVVECTGLDPGPDHSGGRASDVSQGAQRSMSAVCLTIAAGCGR